MTLEKRFRCDPAVPLNLDALVAATEWIHEQEAELHAKHYHALTVGIEALHDSVRAWVHA